MKTISSNKLNLVNNKMTAWYQTGREPMWTRILLTRENRHVQAKDLVLILPEKYSDQ